MTDASVVLGYLNPKNFAGGTVPLYPELAVEAIEKNIAGPLGLSIDQAALGIHRVLDTQMAEGIRLATIRQGLDPRKFTLVALGGAGPLHVTALARDLAIRSILIPRHPGVLSARGLLGAPIEHEVSMAFPRAHKNVSLEELQTALKELDRKCSKLTAFEGLGEDDFEIQYYADLCHTGQSYHLEIPLHLDSPDPLGQLHRDFLAAHDRIYGYNTESPISIVNLRTTHRSHNKVAGQDTEYQPSGDEPIKGSRPIRLADGSDVVEVPVYEREALPVGMVIEGAAILEQADTTTLIEPGWQGQVMDGGNILLTSRQG